MLHKEEQHGLKHVFHSVTEDEGESQQRGRESGEALRGGIASK